MLKKAVVFVGLFVFLFSCSESYKKPSDPLEAGTDFIRFALDGDMIKAKSFVLPNADNESLFREAEKNYVEKSAGEKSEYRNSSIRIKKSQLVNDSTMLITYSNSFRNTDNEIKLVKLNGEWWVDFKYTFTGEEVDVNKEAE